MVKLAWEQLDKMRTPVYAYDYQEIEARCINLQTALTEEIELFYSEKANPNMQLLKKIKELTKGVEVASGPELENAIAAGYSLENIIFVGPGKTGEELAFASEKQIYCIVCESLEEMIKINEIGGKLQKKVSCAIRVNPVMANAGNRMKMGGVARPFGIDEEKVYEVLESIMNLPFVNMIGIYVYNGTQNLSIDKICEGFQGIFEIALKCEQVAGKRIEFIGLGGGYGVPYFEGESELDMDVLRQKVTELLHEYLPRFSRSLRLVSESGRYLVAAGGYYIVRVLYKKESRGKKFLIVDGGTNFFSAPSGMGHFLRRKFPVSIIQKEKSIGEECVSIVGPLCTPTDELMHDELLPAADVNDFIVFRNAGAYGLTASPMFFLSHELPDEIIWREEDR